MEADATPPAGDWQPPALPLDPDRPAIDDPFEEETVYRQQRAARRLRFRPGVLLAIATGGALGAPARYGIGVALPTTSAGFPWATFVTNISGSLLLGLLLVLLADRFPPSRYARPFLATGFLGAYTTFSTFAVETDLLFQHNHPDVATAYAVGSVAAGLAAAWVGIVLGRLLAGLGRT